MTAPFESGVLAISPLRPLLVVFERVSASVPGRRDPGSTRTLRQSAGSSPVLGSATSSGHPSSTPMVRTGRPVRDIPGADWSECALRPRRRRIHLRGGSRPARDAPDRGPAAAPDGCPWDRKQTHQSLAPQSRRRGLRAGGCHRPWRHGEPRRRTGRSLPADPDAGPDCPRDTAISRSRTSTGESRPRSSGATRMSSATQRPRTPTTWSASGNRSRRRSGPRAARPRGKDVDGEPFSMPALTRATRVLTKHPVAM